MSRFGWFIAGLGLGAFAAVQAKENPQVKQAADELMTAAKDFGNAVAEGYKEREAELSKPKPKTTKKQ
ncbi:MAG: hypothetical protein RLZZ212_408 [Actinomycetota bacterium]|jgi:hypothetical protein